MYKEILERHGVEQTPEFTLSVLTYQVGALHKLSVYAKRFGSTGYLGDGGIELGDLITQAKLLAEQYGFDPETLELDGLVRFSERIAEVKEKEK